MDNTRRITIYQRPLGPCRTVDGFYRLTDRQRRRVRKKGYRMQQEPIRDVLAREAEEAEVRAEAEERGEAEPARSFRHRGGEGRPTVIPEELLDTPDEPNQALRKAAADNADLLQNDWRPNEHK